MPIVRIVAILSGEVARSEVNGAKIGAVWTARIIAGRVGTRPRDRRSPLASVARGSRTVSTTLCHDRGLPSRCWSARTDRSFSNSARRCAPTPCVLQSIRMFPRRGSTTAARLPVESRLRDAPISNECRPARPLPLRRLTARYVRRYIHAARANGDTRLDVASHCDRVRSQDRTANVVVVHSTSLR